MQQIGRGVPDIQKQWGLIEGMSRLCLSLGKYLKWDRLEYSGFTTFWSKWVNRLLEVHKKSRTRDKVGTQEVKEGHNWLEKEVTVKKLIPLRGSIWGEWLEGNGIGSGGRILGIRASSGWSRIDGSQLSIFREHKDGRAGTSRNGNIIDSRWEELKTRDRRCIGGWSSLIIIIWGGHDDRGILHSIRSRN